MNEKVIGILHDLQENEYDTRTNDLKEIENEFSENNDEI